MKSQTDFLGLNPAYGESEYLCYLQGYYEAMTASNSNLERLANYVLGALDKVSQRVRWPETADAYDRIDENVRRTE